MPTDVQYEDRHCKYRVPEPDLVFDATYRLLKRQGRGNRLEELAQTHTWYRARQGPDDNTLQGLSCTGAPENKHSNIT